MNNIIERVWNRNSMVNIEDLRGMTFQAEEEGHTFRIRGVDGNGNDVALSGTPSGVMLRPDNTDVALDCEVSEGVVSATLPAECYDVQGRFGITIFLTSDDQKTAIYAAVGSVARTTSGNASPGTTASVVDLVNAINAAIAAIPASDTNIKAAMAPTYSGTGLYSVGQCAWDGGVLYECIVPIMEAENPRVAAHWKTADLSNSICDLKSAFAPYAELVDLTTYDNYYVTNSGSYTATANDVHSKVTELKAGEKIILYGYGYSTAVSVFAKRNGTEGSYTYTPLVKSKVSTLQTYTYTATEDMTVIVSFRTKVSGNNVVNVCNIYKVEGMISKSEDETKTELYNALHRNELYEKNDLSNPDEFYVNQIGSYVATAEGIKSIVVNVLAGQTIILDGYGYYTVVSIFAKRTGTVGNYTYIGLVRSIDSTKRVYSYKAEEDMTVVVSFRTGTDRTNESYTIYKACENYAKIISEKLDLTEYNKLFINTNNLYNFKEAKNNTSISSSTGEESENNDRWATGFIPFDRTISTNVIYTRVAVSAYFYKSNKSFNGVLGTSTYPVPVPEETAYIRFVFLKSAIPYEKADTFFVTYGNDYPTINNPYQKITESISVKPLGYFDLNDIGGQTFTESFAVNVLRGYESWKNLIVRVRAKYTGDNAPYVTFRFIRGKRTETADTSVFTSIYYMLGGKNSYNSQSFRVPPFPLGISWMRVEFTVPSGTTLYIQDIHSEYSNAISPTHDGVRFNAHQGFIQLCPQDTIVGYEMAARLGFKTCIAIPKVTSDGKFVCFHDDDKVGTKLIDANGDLLSNELRNQPISYFSSPQLATYYVNPGSTALAKLMYPNEKIPTLEDFFDVCSKTGMHPMLSTHPPLTVEQWQEVKRIAKERNVLKTLNVKFARDTGEQATDAYSVFGDEIESYVVDVNNVQSTGINYMQTYFAEAKNRLCIELIDNTGVVTDEKIAAIVAAGYECSIANVSRLSTEQMKHWISIGVTEFTIDYFASPGLNW